MDALHATATEDRSVKLVAILISGLLLVGTWVFAAGRILQRIEQVEKEHQQFKVDVSNQLIMLSDGQVEVMRKLDVMIAEQRILHGRHR